jgi:hypothetical protein
LENFDTIGEFSLAFRKAPERTTSSGREELQQVLKIPSPPMQHGLLNTSRGTLQLPTRPNRFVAKYEAALASGREAAWELFVKTAWAVCKDPQPDELIWLLQTVSSMPKNYRAATSLARVASQLSSYRPELRPTTSMALLMLAGHPSPEVRMVALEAAADGDVEVAKRIVQHITATGDEPHKSVREVIETIKAMR